MRCSKMSNFRVRILKWNKIKTPDHLRIKSNCRTKHKPNIHTLPETPMLRRMQYKIICSPCSLVHASSSYPIRHFWIILNFMELTHVSPACAAVTQNLYVCRLWHPSTVCVCVCQLRQYSMCYLLIEFCIFMEMKVRTCMWNAKIPDVNRVGFGEFDAKYRHSIEKFKCSIAFNVNCENISHTHTQITHLSTLKSQTQIRKETNYFLHHNSRHDLTQLIRVRAVKTDRPNCCWTFESPHSHTNRKI